MEDNIYAIIPARLASTRLPEKILAIINGKPMFWHTFMAVKKVLDKVYLAIDSEKTAQFAKSFNIPYIMTSELHQSGSDRLYEAAKILNLNSSDIIINVQADEPLIEKSALLALIKLIKQKNVKVASLAYKITELESENPNLVKVVLNNDNQALYFSRSKIPYKRENTHINYYGHIGLYAYYFEHLKSFVHFERGTLESVESLEQLRFLENGISIHLALVEARSKGVDCKEDLDYAIEVMRKKALEYI